MVEERPEIKERNKQVQEIVLVAAAEVVVGTAPQDQQIDLEDQIRRGREMIKHLIDKRQKIRKNLNYPSL